MYTYLKLVPCFRLELRSLEMKKIFATLRALVVVMEALSKDAAPDGVGRKIMEEVIHALFRNLISVYPVISLA